jgi:hypothetical protein
VGTYIDVEGVDVREDSIGFLGLLTEAEHLPEAIRLLSLLNKGHLFASFLVLLKDFDVPLGLLDVRLLAVLRDLSPDPNMDMGLTLHDEDTSRVESLLVDPMVKVL